MISSANVSIKSLLMSHYSLSEFLLQIKTFWKTLIFESVELTLHGRSAISLTFWHLQSLVIGHLRIFSTMVKKS